MKLTRSREKGISSEGSVRMKTKDKAQANQEGWLMGVAIPLVIAVLANSLGVLQFLSIL